MIIKNWTHHHVNENGILKSGGSVDLKKVIRTSSSDGCLIESCKCQKGLWVSINYGYDKKRKVLSGVTYYFANSIEFNAFTKKLNISPDS